VNVADPDHGPAVAGAPLRRPSVVTLLTVGALAIVGGIIWVLIAQGSADHATTSASSVGVLPVHVYAQYTQRVVHDYSALWMGALVAIVGVLLVVAGVIVAAARRRLR